MELPASAHHRYCMWSSVKRYQRASLASRDIRYGGLHSWALLEAVTLVAICSGKYEGCEAAALRLNILYYLATSNKAHEDRRARNSRASSRPALLSVAPPPDVTTVLGCDVMRQPNIEEGPNSVPPGLVR
ncbi:hypothetical protein NDU88_001577 [Pleurodeles waltl]|uniref:Uncharacterized protein n=1 Tax=Pleurodeles waltl TaxID=8319 RepID=A0AAV7LY12_PLEWA|nr:hypothetical protein NDU88_001577 [Pleurodeles waltl]